MQNIRFAVLVLFLAVCCGACTAGDNSSDSSASAIPNTSANKDRQAALQAELKTPKEKKPGEIVISFRYRPQYALHLDQSMKVVSFEAWNDDAAILKKQTKKRWKKKRYEKAVRNITEQAIIDGFISDNNPGISVQVEQETDSLLSDERSDTTMGWFQDSDRITFIDTESIGKTVVEEMEGLIEIHGITAEIELLQEDIR